MGTIYLRWITNIKLLCSTGNSTQLYDSLDRRGVLGTRIPGYILLSSFTVHLKLRILLISYTPIQKTFLNKVWIVRMQEENQHSLQRKQGVYVINWTEVREMVWGGRWEGGSGLGTQVHLRQIHVDIWQNQYSIVKQNLKINK